LHIKVPKKVPHNLLFSEHTWWQGMDKPIDGMGNPIFPNLFPKLFVLQILRKCLSKVVGGRRTIVRKGNAKGK
jgi:hypothetical protein